MEGKKKLKKHDYYNDEEMSDFEKYMAISWGSPEGLAKFFLPLSLLILSFSAFILSIGGFLWLLHLANIIK
jgi:hypothetical protein